MIKMCDVNEDNLLTIFNELDVQLLNLDNNVIKGWFDTDDVNMKYLLHWICRSFSKENLVHHLEYSE